MSRRIHHYATLEAIATRPANMIRRSAAALTRPPLALATPKPHFRPGLAARPAIRMDQKARVAITWGYAARRQHRPAPRPQRPVFHPMERLKHQFFR